MTPPKKGILAISKAGLDLDDSRLAQVADRLSQTPERYKNGYLRALAGRSPTAGIKAHCLSCVGWDRGEIRRCTATACALYPYRPYQVD